MTLSDQRTQLDVLTILAMLLTRIMKQSPDAHILVKRPRDGCINYYCRQRGMVVHAEKVPELATSVTQSAMKWNF